MATITLNDSIRAAAKANPASLMMIVGLYTSTGKVNNIDRCMIERESENFMRKAQEDVTFERKDFDTDEAYTDQVNHHIIMKALATELNERFRSSTIPGMIKEMYGRIKGNVETREAWNGLTESTRALEDAFINKALAELY
ncbi:hypothetical protein BIZ83_gp138 [Erwinia phage vB_EamM_ChrisDB]|uniref:hypothetical protein n=1 Tax=Erwinia phage vB_EamM_ChrisDB TaxID=1883371 RepID=UPI00081C6FA8|nr:hypothetical protein BIZ83_gp138 [Erwinia phage vB_EamM_ChrisDB]ANZ48715.1 hypothetical protein CHRISDB_153 [Erwinia phage vB_EamM_ChrisDB]